MVRDVFYQSEIVSGCDHGFLSVAPSDEQVDELFALLRVSAGEEFADAQGRPYRIYRGQPIQELL